MVRGSKSDSFQLEDAIGFDIIDNTERKFAWYGKEPGVVQPLLKWETTWENNK